MPAMNASDFIVQSLVDCGVKNVYGGHGGALVPLVNAVCAHSELRWVCTRNEANASLMAAAESKLSGQCTLGACIATSGPGASNLLTGLLDGHMDRVPMIAITGTKPRADAAHSEFQDIDQSAIFAAGRMAMSITISDPLQLVAVLRDAVATALTHSVCVHVAVPVDIQGMEIQAPLHLCSASPALLRKRIEGKAGDPEAINEIAGLITAEGERIVIAVGLHARDAGAEILKLAETINAPVVTRLDAKGAIDESHPLSLGCVGVHGKPGMAAAGAMLELASIVVIFGVTDPTVLLCDKYGLQHRRMIEVCVDSFDVSTRFRADVSLVANPKLVCQQLCEVIGADVSRAAKRAKTVDAPAPLSQPLGERLWKVVNSGLALSRHLSHQMGRFVPEAEKQSNFSNQAGFCHPGVLMRALGPKLQPHDVVCIDTGDVTLWAASCLRLTAGQITLSSERLGTMGYALCAAIAASLLRPSAKGVVIVGDGGFQMTMNELGTAVQHRTNLLVIVIDNGLLGRVEHGFTNAQGCELTGCDWVALAKCYGGDGLTLDNDGDVDAALTTAMAASGLFILAVRCDPNLKAEMAKLSEEPPCWLEGSLDKVDSG